MWFQGVYENKYEYMGEYDLLVPAFLMDLGFYYLGVASQPFKRGVVGLTEPAVIRTPPSTPFFYLMRAYNRRFASMARARRARNGLGRANAGRRFMFPGYTFAPGSAVYIAKALAAWAWLELKEGWRSWFLKPEPAPQSREVPLKPALKPTSNF